jgi:hypothetical protein
MVTGTWYDARAEADKSESANTGFILRIVEADWMREEALSDEQSRD